LQSLYLQNPFVVVLVSCFQLPPSVHVYRVLQLILQRLDFGPLVQQLLFLETGLSLEIVHTPDLPIDRKKLIPESS